MVYEPNILSMGSGVPHGPVPDFLYPRTPALHTSHRATRTDDRGMTERIREQIARTLRELDFMPKGREVVSKIISGVL
jgi:hypothetical protein